MMSMTNLVVLFFLATVTVWLLKKGDPRDRTLLAIASLMYIAAMFGTFWKFGSGNEMVHYVLLESAGYFLVLLSRLAKSKSKTK
jgi:hypothetical protein